MKILNYGSMNLDHVYAVPHFVLPGETISATGRNLFCGGKGLNQSIAVAKAGGEIYHAGIVGEDGDVLVDALCFAGVRVGRIRHVQGASAHTIIQVSPEGQNSIIVFSGENVRPTEENMDQMLEGFGPGDLLMLQNELYGSAEMLKKAAARGMQIAFNPSPADEGLKAFDLDKVNWLIMNEIEGNLLTGQKEPEEILNSFREKHPWTSVVLTIGRDGAWLMRGEKRVYQPAFQVKTVDTTAAGDTFTGYFLAGVADGLTDEQNMRRAALAASLAVGRAGAADSIPLKEEVEEAEKSAA